MLTRADRVLIDERAGRIIILPSFLFHERSTSVELDVWLYKWRIYIFSAFKYVRRKLARVQPNPLVSSSRSRENRNYQSLPLRVPAAHLISFT